MTANTYSEAITVLYMCTCGLAIHINNVNFNNQTPLHVQQESKDLLSVILLIMYQKILTQKTHTTIQKA